jgi:sterol desaturase/sphingolipid hydroxylase (fatty acid hydroxylase superfamily)
MIQQIIQYFEHIPSPHRAFILAAGISVFWLIEGIFPLVNFGYKKWKHAKINIIFTISTLIINFFFATLIVKASDYTTLHQIGILHLINLPDWAFLLLGLLVLDLVGAWLIHFIEHKIKVLWKFHIIHHADTQVDTTTANRHHPGESVFRAIFTILGVLICGAPIWLVMLYQSLSAAFSQFNHANIRLPKKLDNMISWLIVSPDMHKIHHHFERPQTDTNFGNIFSIWDRLFGTFDQTPVGQIKYGLDVIDNSRDEDLAYQIQIPFDKNVKTDY